MAAVRAVASELLANTFVMRTDEKSFYKSIDQYLLIDALAAYVPDRFVLNLLWQAMRRSTSVPVFSETHLGKISDKYPPVTIR